MSGLQILRIAPCFAVYLLNSVFRLCRTAIFHQPRTPINIILPLPLFWDLFCAEVGAG